MNKGLKMKNKKSGRGLYCTYSFTGFKEVQNACGVASIRRLLKIIGLFADYTSLFQGSSAKETYNLKERTNRSHSILNKSADNMSIV